MNTTQERRSAGRIQFLWPLWFGYDQDGEFYRGQIYDLSRSGASFLIRQDQSPAPGSRLLIRFSYPQGLSDGFELDSYYSWAQVVRVDQVGTGFNKVALRLENQLTHDPAAPEKLGQEELALAAV